MIPRKVWRFWGNPPQPEWIEQCEKSWDALRPFGFDIITLTEPPFELYNQDLYDNASEYTDKVWQLRADLLRYELLWTFGGWWVDADCELIDPEVFSLLCDTDKAVIGWEVERKWLGNSVIGAPPAHPFMDRLTIYAEQSMNSRKGKGVTVQTGPQYLTEHWRPRRDDVTVLPQATFYPYGWRQAQQNRRPTRYPPQTLVAHHWHNRTTKPPQIGQK